MSTILVAVDGSECSLRALDSAVAFAERLGDEILLCHVVDLERAAEISAGAPQLAVESLAELRSESEKILSDAERRTGGRVTVRRRSVEGAPVDAIEVLAREVAPSFIAIGSHGRGGLARLLMGSVAEGLLRTASTPVMVVRCFR